MKLERPDLTADQLGDDIWLAIEGVPCLCCEGETHRGPFVGADVRALLDPCETCGGSGWDYDVNCAGCIDGRRKFDIVVPWGDGYAGMVSRTYTVADAPALLPVLRCGLDWDEESPVILFGAGTGRAYLCHPYPLEQSTPITLVGYDPERTTHALHLRAAGRMDGRMDD